MIKKLKDWWDKNLRDDYDRLNTGRVSQFFSLAVVGSFSVFASVFFVKSAAQYVFSGGLDPAAFEKIALAAGAVFGAVVVPMLTYRMKSGKK